MKYTCGRRTSRALSCGATREATVAPPNLPPSGRPPPAAVATHRRAAAAAHSAPAKPVAAVPSRPLPPPYPHPCPSSSSSGELRRARRPAARIQAPLSRIRPPYAWICSLRAQGHASWSPLGGSAPCRAAPGRSCRGGTLLGRWWHCATWGYAAWEPGAAVLVVDAFVGLQRHRQQRVCALRRTGFLVRAASPCQPVSPPPAAPCSGAGFGARALVLLYRRGTLFACGLPGAWQCGASGLGGVARRIRRLASW